MKTKNLVLAAAFAAIGFTSTQASAALVTQWTYSVTVDWVIAGDDVPTFGGGSNTAALGLGTQTVAANLLSWGAEDGDHNVTTEPASNSRSALGITNSPANGVVNTNGLDANTATITHFNNAISSSFDTLQTATLVTTLRLTPLSPEVGDELGPFEQVFTTTFFETPNVTGGANPTAACGFPSVNRCDDIFILSLPDLQFMFTLNDIEYTTTVKAAGLDFLPEDTCTAAEQLAGCFGLTTPERQITPVQFGFNITAVVDEVPEPATLALLGLGLLGLAASRRRKED